MYSIAIRDNLIVAVLCGAVGDSIISKSEYDEVKALFLSAPVAPDGYIYRLRADNWEWELVELPYTPPVEEPDVTAEEALDFLFGGES